MLSHWCITVCYGQWDENFNRNEMVKSQLSKSKMAAKREPSISAAICLCQWETTSPEQGKMVCFSKLSLYLFYTNLFNKLFVKNGRFLSQKNLFDYYPDASFTRNGACLTPIYERAADEYIEFAQTLMKANTNKSKWLLLDLDGCWLMNDDRDFWLVFDDIGYWLMCEDRGCWLVFDDTGCWLVFDDRDCWLVLMK